MNGGILAVNASNQAMYNGAVSAPIRGIGKVMTTKFESDE